MRHGNSNRFAFVQNYRCDASRCPEGWRTPKPIPIPCQSVSHDRWLGEEARGEGRGANVPSEFDRTATCGWLRDGRKKHRAGAEAPIREFVIPASDKSFGAGRS